MTGVKGGCWRFTLAIAVIVAALALGMPGCGEGDDGATAEPSSEFEVRGGDNSVQRFGREGSSAERQQAAIAVAGYLDAVAAEDFSAQCEYLARSSVESFEQDPTGTCARTLSQVRGGAGKGGFGVMAGPVASLRVEGTQGFALYHGKGGVDYVLPLKREGDEWKVASLVPVEL